MSGDKQNSYTRAFRVIINYIISSATTNAFYGDDDGKAKKYPGYVAFYPDGYLEDSPDRRAKVGDLVRLGSVIRPNEWYLSWYMGETKHYYKNEDGTIEDENRYESTYLLKSIETGNLCNWSNVSLAYFDRKTLEDFPSWKWNDRQFEFNDKWMHICEVEKDAYLIRPLYAEFGEGYEVTLGTRQRWNHSNPYLPKKTFPDYRKVTKTIMADFYDECVANEPRSNVL